MKTSTVVNTQLFPDGLRPAHVLARVLALLCSWLRFNVGSAGRGILGANRAQVSLAYPLTLC